MTETMHMLPEWVPQDAILLAWPHSQSDWAPLLPEVQRTYCDIIEQITRFEPVVLLVPQKPEEYDTLPSELRDRCLLIPCPTNDTWCRDYGPIAVQSECGKRGIIDFTFNAWGGKFAATLDNQVVRRLVASEVFAPEIAYLDALDLTFEGGALECNGAGFLLTTKPCIEDPLRNPHFSDTPHIYRELMQRLGMTDYCSLDVTPLPGDDTDGHIDTIARFVNPDTILYVSPSDTTAQGFPTLLQLEKQLQELVHLHPHLRLIALPDVGDYPSRYEADGLIPASYANFLMVNKAVLLPTYGCSTDSDAVRILQQALPHLEIVPIDCSILLEQHGSLHCISMQIPKGFLNPSLLAPILSKHFNR